MGLRVRNRNADEDDNMRAPAVSRAMPSQRVLTISLGATALPDTRQKLYNTLIVGFFSSVTEMLMKSRI